LILLCVDGIDPDLVQEFGWGKLFKHNYSLKIPQECYVPDPDLGSTPHTTRVWPTIFSGKKIDHGLIKREGPRKILHDVLVRARITWKAKPQFRLFPSNLDLETIFDEYYSFTWNLPTMNPEWISTFPSYEAFVKYSRRELNMWIRMTHGAKYFDVPLQAYYLRYVDYVGHNTPDILKSAYDIVFLQASDLKKAGQDVILLSDHGCKDGLHTERAYLGSDWKFNAEWVHELREDFTRIFDKGLERLKTR
jgi:hypothetical protein